MYYVIMPTNSDLQHHGILGQKWGRRNGPPYPLDGSVSTGSRLKKKKGKKISISQLLLKHILNVEQMLVLQLLKKTLIRCLIRN